MSNLQKDTLNALICLYIMAILNSRQILTLYELQIKIKDILEKKNIRIDKKIIHFQIVFQTWFNKSIFVHFL